MSKPFIINGGIFHYEILVGYGCSEKQLLSAAKKHCGGWDVAKEIEGTTSGRFIWHDNNYSIVWVPTESLPSLVHELTHAAMFILDSVGVPITKDNEETFAYLMGHLMHQVVDKVYK